MPPAIPESPDAGDKWDASVCQRLAQAGTNKSIGAGNKQFLHAAMLQKIIYKALLYPSCCSAPIFGGP